MICINDFCNTCGEGVDVKIAFYDPVSDNLICQIMLFDANKSYKTVAATYAYAPIKTFYKVADFIVCEAYV